MAPGADCGLLAEDECKARDTEEQKEGESRCFFTLPLEREDDDDYTDADDTGGDDSNGDDSNGDDSNGDDEVDDPFAGGPGPIVEDDDGNIGGFTPANGATTFCCFLCSCTMYMLFSASCFCVFHFPQDAC